MSCGHQWGRQMRALWPVKPQPPPQLFSLMRGSLNYDIEAIHPSSIRCIIDLCRSVAGWTVPVCSMSRSCSIPPIRKSIKLLSTSFVIGSSGICVHSSRRSNKNASTLGINLVNATNWRLQNPIFLLLPAAPAHRRNYSNRNRYIKRLLTMDNGYMNIWTLCLRNCILHDSGFVVHFNWKVTSLRGT
jgi:hypothetical protein